VPGNRFAYANAREQPSTNKL